MNYRPCTYYIEKSRVIVKFDDFVESQKRELVFTSSRYDCSLMCANTTEAYDSEESDKYFLVRKDFSSIIIPGGSDNEIHKAIVNNLSDIKNQVIANFGYVWV